jgi:hypothetical protein
MLTVFQDFLVAMQAELPIELLEQIPLQRLTNISLGSLYPMKLTKTSCFIPGKETLTPVRVSLQGWSMATRLMTSSLTVYLPRVCLTLGGSISLAEVTRTLKIIMMKMLLRWEEDFTKSFVGKRILGRQTGEQIHPALKGPSDFLHDDDDDDLCGGTNGPDHQKAHLDIPRGNAHMPFFKEKSD